LRLRAIALALRAKEASRHFLERSHPSSAEEGTSLAHSDFLVCYK